MNADYLPGKQRNSRQKSVLLTFKLLATQGDSLRAQSSQSSAKFAKRKAGDSFVAFLAIFASLRTLRSNCEFTGVDYSLAALCLSVLHPVANPVINRAART